MENNFPCEVGQSCEKCNAEKCPGLTPAHKNAIQTAKALRRMDKVNNPLEQGYSDNWSDDDWSEEY